MTWRVETTVAPTSSPVTTEEAKAHARIAYSTDDATVGTLIEAATAHVEQVTGRFLSPRSVVCTRYDATGAEIRLPAAPIRTVTRLDFGGAPDANSAPTWVEVPNTRYSLVGAFSVAPLIHVWSAPHEVYTWQHVRVALDVGYASVAAIPNDLKTALLLLVGHWYENRQEVVVGAVAAPMLRAVDALLGPYTLGV